MRKILLGVIAVAFIAGGWLFLTSGTRQYRKISGNYQIEDETGGRQWHLYIGKHSGDDFWFTVYDNHGVTGGREDPWIEGTVEKTTRRQLTVLADPELFENMNIGWQMENSRLVLEYEKNGPVIRLTNNGISLTFREVEYYTN